MLMDLDQLVVTTSRTVGYIFAEVVCYLLMELLKEVRIQHPVTI